MKHIILIGFMGAGKTTIGKLLSEVLHLPFVDADQVIELKMGISIPEIFEKLGESQFRALEHAFCEDLVRLEPSVVATGGKMPCSDENLALLKSVGTVVYVNASLQTITARLKQHKSDRPLLEKIGEEALFRFVEDEITERKVFYKQAHLIFPNESNNPEKAVMQLKELVS
jgi:shikimate kinase